LFVLSNSNIISLNPNISRAFDEASVDTLIYLFKKENVSADICIWSFNSENQFELKHLINQNSIKSNEGYVFDVEANFEFKQVLLKVRNNSKSLEEEFEITRGVNPYDKYRGQAEEVISTKAYHADHKKDETFVPEIRGKHVAPYHYQWDKRHYISYGNWLAAARDPKFFSGERLIFREIIGKRFVCTLIEEPFIIDRSLYIAKPKSNLINLSFVLGVLSSKLLVWLFKYEKNEFDDLFPKIRLEEFKKLPIPKNKSNSISIAKIVSDILILKNTEVAADTTALESEIDRLVYQLYGLTEEEIRIVEGS
jgi:adenine-specific DNA-methyltransferase